GRPSCRPRSIPSASESSLDPLTRRLGRRFVALRLVSRTRRADPAGLADDLDDTPGLALRQRTTLADRDRIADAARVVLVVRHDLRRPANELAVDRMPNQALDRNRNALVHLVADHAADDSASGFLAGARRLAARALSRAHALSPFCRARSASTVLILAMSLRTLPCWSGFAPWPVCAWIRRLNCSRRSFSSSSARLSSVMARNSLAFIATPDARRRPSGSAAWPRRDGTPRGRPPG